MSGKSFNSIELGELLTRMRGGDENAIEELARRVCIRLQRLTRKMLKEYPGVKRWAETDDVFQNAIMRLFRALKSVSPASTLEFFRLGALQVRRELRDLARRYFGARGVGANHASHHLRAGEEAIDPQDPHCEPSKLGKFHEIADGLPEDLRDVVDQLYYFGFTREEAAENLGVSVETIYRRWRDARLLLQKQLKDE